MASAVAKSEMASEDCSICMAALSSMCRATPDKCAHIFHLQCLEKWFQSSTATSAECPLCRSVSSGILTHPGRKALPLPKRLAPPSDEADEFAAEAAAPDSTSTASSDAEYIPEVRIRISDNRRPTRRSMHMQSAPVSTRRGQPPVRGTSRPAAATASCEVCNLSITTRVAVLMCAACDEKCAHARCARGLPNRCPPGTFVCERCNDEQGASDSFVRLFDATVGQRTQQQRRQQAVVADDNEDAEFDSDAEEGDQARSANMGGQKVDEEPPFDSDAEDGDVARIAYMQRRARAQEDVVFNSYAEEDRTRLPDFDSDDEDGDLSRPAHSVRRRRVKREEEEEIDEREQSDEEMEETDDDEEEDESSSDKESESEQEEGRPLFISGEEEDDEMLRDEPGPSVGRPRHMVDRTRKRKTKKSKKATKKARKASKRNADPARVRKTSGGVQKRRRKTRKAKRGDRRASASGALPPPPAGYHERQPRLSLLGCGIEPPMPSEEINSVPVRDSPPRVASSPVDLLGSVLTAQALALAPGRHFRQEGGQFVPTESISRHFERVETRLNDRLKASIKDRTGILPGREVLSSGGQQQQASGTGAGAEKTTAVSTLKPAASKGGGNDSKELGAAVHAYSASTSLPTSSRNGSVVTNGRGITGAPATSPSALASSSVVPPLVPLAGPRPFQIKTEPGVSPKPSTSRDPRPSVLSATAGASSSVVPPTVPKPVPPPVKVKIEPSRSSKPSNSLDTHRSVSCTSKGALKGLKTKQSEKTRKQNDFVPYIEHHAKKVLDPLFRSKKLTKEQYKHSLKWAVTTSLAQRWKKDRIVPLLEVHLFNLYGFPTP